MNKLVELYHRADTQEERNNILCEITEKYTMGEIAKEELDDETIRKCHAVCFEDYFYEEELCEMLGVSKEEYLKTLDEETEHNIEVNIGDIVAFDANARYKDITMWNLVRKKLIPALPSKPDEIFVRFVISIID